MSNISATQVRELRERTGAPMMDCKKHLLETNGDIEKAIENMRKSGATKAAKKEGRITAEGIVVTLVAEDGKTGVIIEINSETDFVSRSDDFKNFAATVAKTALANGITDIEQLKNTATSDGQTLEQVRQHLVAKIGENINLRRAVLLKTQGRIVSYIHGDRIGVLVNMEQGDEAIGKDMAMQIAASNPLVVAPEDVSPELMAKEKEIYMAQASESGKPQNIVEKMVEGSIRKFLDQATLLGQSFIKDPNKKVGDVLTAAKAKVAKFVRYEVGEGIEKQSQNFAEEVMAQVRGSE